MGSESVKTSKYSSSRSPRTEENNSYSANSNIMSSNNSTSNKANTPQMVKQNKISSNYADPHTPIASAKRPRNPSRSSFSGRPNNSPQLVPTIESNTATPTSNARKNCQTPSRRISTPVEPLSPMHPARPMNAHHGYTPAQVNAADNDFQDNNVGEVVDGSIEVTSSSSTWGALFSPVLSFLGQPQPTNSKGDEKLDDTKQEISQSNLKDNVIYDEDGDVSMADLSKMEHVSHTSTITTDTNATPDDNSIQPHVPNPQKTLSSTEIQSPHVEESSEEEYIDYDDDCSDIEEEFNPYLFIKRLPIYSTVVPFELRVHLPPKDKNDPRQTLVLDLDETLVHCTVEPNTPNVDMVFPVIFHGIEYQVHVKKRPYLKEFLESVYKEFEVVVFTASQKVYADELLDRIDPEKKYIKYRMFRESCLPVEGNYLKDLNVLGRDLSTAVLVDNSPHAFGYQVDNGIPIESWFDDPNDTELLKLEQFLRTLKGVQDVRPLVRAKFQTHRLIDEA